MRTSSPPLPPPPSPQESKNEESFSRLPLRWKRKPSPQEAKNEETFRFHYRSFDGTMVEIEASQDECPNSFGWAANTFMRRGYNPADGAAMDAIMQAGWREVGRLEYDDEYEDDAMYVDMTPKDLCKEDVVIFRSPDGTTESAARYEGNDFFSYVGKDGTCYFENRANFIASHLSALKCGATIMRETNGHPQKPRKDYMSKVKFPPISRDCEKTSVAKLGFLRVPIFFGERF